MKAPDSDYSPKLLRARQTGIALVLVLGFLVLLTVLIVAFFTSVSNEYTSAKTFVAGTSTRFLADSAVNLVEGQIVEGTKGQVGTTTARQTWASQPGMIRTYDDTGSKGNAYKLYSASKMVIAGKDAANEMALDVPKGWEKQPALYSDLNAPVAGADKNPDGTVMLHFPIVDGNVKSVTLANGSKVLSYNDDGDTKPDIEGFGIDPTNLTNYKAGEPISETNNPAAMPVKWLYVLKDGTMIAPDDAGAGGGTKATFNGANKPTKDNPITGRVAFWTDDESSKLNINTASEGTYYAFPHTNSPMDMLGSSNKSFACSPPANWEYNRYPGHPATTCLSVALGKWFDGSSGTVPPNAYTTNDSTYLTSLASYLTISPRVSIGGSKAGTISALTNPGAQSDVPTNSQYQAITDSTADPLTDRLYTSVDELMFRPNRTVTSSKLNNIALERLRFFLTASSRASELTPFNTPKVSMWPQWKDKADRDSIPNDASLLASSKLLAFCSSFGKSTDLTNNPSGKNEYFFQRNRPVAKSGVNPSWKSSLQDWEQVQRNQQLANYLAKLGTKSIPGYGAAFISPTKYSQTAFSNIIVQSMDMLRCNVGKMAYIMPSGVVEDYIPGLVVKTGLPGATNLTPLKGFGEYPVITQVGLGVGLDQNGSPIVFFVLDTFSPLQSYPPINAPFNIKIEDMQNLGITPLPGKTNPTKIDNIGVWDWNAYNATKDMALRAYGRSLPGFTFDNTGATVQIGTGQPVTISVLDSDKGDVIQKIKVRFPQTTVPKPTNKLFDAAYVGPASAYHCMNAPGAASVRGVECGMASPVRGDWRLLGGTYDPDTKYGATLFKADANYTNTALQQAHKLRVWEHWEAKQPTMGAPATTSIAGSLVAGFKNTDYSDFDAPCVPSDLTAALTASGAPGDWDTGPGVHPDGPYINPTNQIFVAGTWPFFARNWADGALGGSLFSPNRLVASAVKFGSLPTGIGAASPEPWQTLLFCPNPAARTSAANVKGVGHKGFLNPPDHMYLEFFTMPTVEPYAISEPLSTAGKVNINYQMAPFTNIERSTALRGVLKSTMMTGICGNTVKDPRGHPNPSRGSGYKMSDAAGSGSEVRYDVDRDLTLEGIQDVYFKNGDIFRYPSEICDVFLVPKKINGARYATGAASPPTSYKKMMDWWRPKAPGDLSAMNFTGDNLREEPYDRIYPRLTTKSNTFTVHYRVQVLQKRKNSDPVVWEEDKDQVLAESRGATMLERYVDPSDATFNTQWDQDTRNLNFGGNSNADLSQFYRFRIISTKKFAP